MKYRTLFGEAPKGWTYCTLKDIAQLQQGLQIAKEFRKDNPKSGYIPLLKITDLPSRKFSEYVTDIKEQHIAHKEDIIYTRTGQVGLVYTDVTGCVHNNCFKVIIDYKRFDKYFVYYFLRTKEVFDYQNSVASGSVQKDLKHSAFLSCPIAYPELSIQKKIGKVLKILDDKIKLNNKINDNLELLISNIYESWFENFSAYEETEYKESEIGLIPASWELVELDKICESVSKKHAFNKDQLVFLNTGDVTNGQFAHSNYSDISLMPGQAKKSIKRNDILYSEIRPINQHYAYVNFASEDYVVSTKLMVIRANSISPRRLYNFLTSQKIINDLQMEAESRSGTFPQITFDIIRKKRILIADKITEEKFSKLLEDIYEKIDSNIKENRILSEIRDNLLPKLMAGELNLEI